MINCENIVTQLKSLLDAENSDRYIWEADYRPAIHNAINFSVSVFNSIFGSKKLSEEVLSDLVRMRVYQASSRSRVMFSDGTPPYIYDNTLWSLLAVYPEPEVIPANAPYEDEKIYSVIAKLIFRTGNHSAKRLTLEEWNKNKSNVFEAGNENVLCKKLKRYAYVGFIYFGGMYEKEIEVRPSIANKRVALAYLQVPTKPTLITDNIEFPETMFNFIVNKALQFISYKQGNTDLYGVTDKDIKEVINLFS